MEAQLLDVPAINETPTIIRWGDANHSREVMFEFEFEFALLLDGFEQLHRRGWTSALKTDGARLEGT